MTKYVEIEFSPNTLRGTLAQALVLGVASVLTALAALLAALSSGWLLTPSVTRQPFPFEALLDPFVLIVAVPPTAVGATVGYFVSLLCLLGTRLRWTVPAVALPTVTTAFLFGTSMNWLAAVPTLMVALMSMLLVRGVWVLRHLRW